MKRKGFSFSCPTLMNDKDEVLEFKRFIKVPTTDSDRIHNPFPQTAYAGNYNQACTHSLLYLSYVPRNPKKRVLTAFYNLITFLHEYAHLVLSDTPAKMFARQVLAWAYTCVYYLLTEKSWNEGNWVIFERYNNQLTTICEAIALSEELLATAVSFEEVNSIWRECFEERVKAIQPASFETTNRLWRELFEEGVKAIQKDMENVEKQSINAHQHSPPDFAEKKGHLLSELYAR